jgi:hypothetical protein
MNAIILSFDQAHADKVDNERLEWAEEQAVYFFDQATKPQRAAFIGLTSMADYLHGHGSQAHCATVDLAKRQWHFDTKEARELLAVTVDWFTRHRELSTELDDRWTALQARVQFENSSHFGG